MRLLPIVNFMLFLKPKSIAVHLLLRHYSHWRNFGACYEKVLMSFTLRLHRGMEYERLGRSEKFGSWSDQ